MRRITELKCWTATLTATSALIVLAALLPVASAQWTETLEGEGEVSLGSFCPIPVTAEFGRPRLDASLGEEVMPVRITTAEWIPQHYSFKNVDPQTLGATVEGYIEIVRPAAWTASRDELELTFVQGTLETLVGASGLFTLEVFGTTQEDWEFRVSDTILVAAPIEVQGGGTTTPEGTEGEQPECEGPVDATDEGCPNDDGNEEATTCGPGGPPDCPEEGNESPGTEGSEAGTNDVEEPGGPTSDGEPVTDDGNQGDAGTEGPVDDGDDTGGGDSVTERPGGGGSEGGAGDDNTGGDTGG